MSKSKNRPFLCQRNDYVTVLAVGKQRENWRQARITVLGYITDRKCNFAVLLGVRIKSVKYPYT